MGEHVIVWDLETIPDLDGFASASQLDGKPEPEIRESMGEKFPKLIFHRIACIGALIASRTEESWQVDAIGAPHIGERSEKDLVQAFVERIDELTPRLVTFNGASFDLPVLRYRAMINRVAAPGLSKRNYFNRYTDDAIDLCDVLASFDRGSKVSLDQLSRVLGFPGKPDGIDGSKVDAYCRAGRFKEVADYCETDVVNTYRIWLRYELFRGTLSLSGYEKSEANLASFISARSEKKPHLQDLIRLPASLPPLDQISTQAEKS
jgi:predicted PolB exonuclease-like 3'-5' exonuclease